MQVGDYIVPRKTNGILQIEEIEIIAGNTIYYTCCRKSFHQSQIESLDIVYRREIKKRERKKK